MDLKNCDPNAACKICVVGPPVCNWIQFDNGTVECVDPDQPITGDIAHEIFGNDPERCPPVDIEGGGNIAIYVFLALTSAYTLGSFLYLAGKRFRNFYNSRRNSPESERLLDEAMENPVAGV